MTDKHQCCARVYTFHGFRSSQCSKTAKVERDGKWYCGIHDPVRVKEKEKQRREAYEKEHAASREIHRRETAMKAACRDIPTEALEQDIVHEMLAALKRAKDALQASDKREREAALADAIAAISKIEGA